MSEFNEQSLQSTASDVAYALAIDRIYAVAGEHDWSVADRVLLQVQVAAETVIDDFFPQSSSSLKRHDKIILEHDILKRLQMRGELAQEDQISWRVESYSGASWIEYINSEGEVFTMHCDQMPIEISSVGDSYETRVSYEWLRDNSVAYEPMKHQLDRLNSTKESKRLIPRKKIAHWGRTALAVEHLRSTDPRYEEIYDGKKTYGTFADRFVIGSDTPINGGVYVGLPNGNREAIVVDDEKYPRELDYVYNAIMQRIYRWSRVPRESQLDGVVDKVLSPVFYTVLETMPYSQDIVDQIVSRYAKDTKIVLNQFIYERGGVCRHQALLAGYILERMQKNGELMESDEISVDRNGVMGRSGPGHVWVRYKSADGTVYIIDPAQHFIGTLEEAEARPEAWPYARPGDYI